VFYNRVEQLTDPERISFGQVLGYTVAHELGHFPLGSNSHSPQEIMHAKWSTDDKKRAAKGDLRFTPEQATAIRNRVLTIIRVRSASFPEIQKNPIER
jgi:hypothetical protein